MRTLSVSELLGVWEQGLAQSPLQRALTVLAAACSETPLDGLAALSIGQRNARLLLLREWTFGPQLVSLATCPGCGERVELNFKTADLWGDSQKEFEEPEEQTEILSLNREGYAVQFRLPNSGDLAAITSLVDDSMSQHVLLDRCLVTAVHNGSPQSADRLPADIVEAIEECMEQADPQADMRLLLFCPQCGHGWPAAFDIASFFWGELNAWAQRILHEVHTLAARYGWHERDILAMSPWRRQLYLGMGDG